MARDFVRASNQYIQIDSAAITAPPFTIAGWVNPDNNSSFQEVFFLGDKDNPVQFWHLGLSGSVGGDPVSFGAGDGTVVNASTTSGYTNGTWHHIAGVEISNISRAAYIDGGSKGTNTDNRTPAGADRMAFGRRQDSTPDSALDAQLGEFGLWNIALSDAEIAILAKGFSPLWMHPQSLVAYWPMIRDDDNDLVGGYDMTAFNAPTVAVHPPLIVYPAYKG